MEARSLQYNIDHSLRHRVDPGQITQVHCHRITNGVEQYLVQWKLDLASSSSIPVYSWHEVTELQRCLHLVQSYIENRPKSLQEPDGAAGLPINRKRKSPGDGHVISRDSSHTPYLTPWASPKLASRAQSVASAGSDRCDAEPIVYNGLLKRKEGKILAIAVDKSDQGPLDQRLPTAAMIQAAVTAPVTHAERYIQQAFVEKLKPLRGVRLENDVDASTPPLAFEFIDAYVLRDGVYVADVESYEGCHKPCRPDMGHNIGCEYTRECGCLEYAAVDEDAFKRQWPEAYDRYQRVLARGEYPDTRGLPKRFPYAKPSRNNPGMPSVLQLHYRESRHPIYECNQNCNCGPLCKSRLVQKGRVVPLTIFKTPSRGWGMYCNEDLVPGEFIDTYRGEVITNEEADRRESTGGKDKASYMYSLDKFVGGEDEDLTPESCFVVDGEYMGGPTRFINHSCEPNCRQYTVSYNKNDRRIYDLAFFAYEYIPAGTELTFDYMDRDEEEEEDMAKQQEEDPNNPDAQNRPRCLCGAKKCRGYLW